MTRHTTPHAGGRFGGNQRHGGRDVTRLLADFGHDLPTAPIPAAEAKQARLFRYVPRRFQKVSLGCRGG